MCNLFSNSEKHDSHNLYVICLFFNSSVHEVLFEIADTYSCEKQIYQLDSVHVFSLRVSSQHTIFQS